MQSLFDRSYYLLQNKDVASQPDLDPLAHFLSHGGIEGRDPHPLFDSSFYLKKYPAVAEQQINPLVHFLNEGARQKFDPHPLFSSSFYLTQGLTLEDCNGNPLLHYLSTGADEGLDPHPLFKTQYYLHRLRESGVKNLPDNPLIHYLSDGNNTINPSPIFDGALYAERYPDVAASKANPLLHYVRSGQHESRMGLKLANLSQDINSFGSLSFKNARVILQDMTEESFSHLIVIGCLLRGGYERCASNFVRAIAEKVGINNILVLVTDTEEITCRDWLPENVRIANLASMNPTLTTEEKSLLFMDLVARKRPSTVFAINAPLFWSALDTYSEAWGKEALPTRLISYLGSYEHYVDLNNHGFNDGAFARQIEKIDLFITDTQRLRDAMVQSKSQAGAIESKVVTCYKSLPENLHQTLASQSKTCSSEFASTQSLPEPGSASPRILWASRLQEFKRPDVLAKVAAQMPHVTFEVYGRCDPDFDASELLGLSNVHMYGEFRDFSDIPKYGITAFLYTSKVDGMPHILLEAGACGLPIIAPLIGGIGELLDDSTGWLVSRSGSVEEYVRQIKDILDYPEVARRRAAKLQSRMDQIHSWAAFLSRVEGLKTLTESSNSLISISESNNEPLDRSAIIDSGLFDPVYYLANNPDVAAQKVDPLTHYLLHGGFEGRNPHPLFDSAYYRRQAGIAGNEKQNPLLHYIQRGARKGFDPHPLFSTSFYLQQGSSAENGLSSALVHYLEKGASEGFDPHPLFDGAFYMKQFEQLDESKSECNPLIHYLSIGSKLGLNPGPDFDAKAYCERYSDVFSAGVNPLLHYVTTGEVEGRTRRNIVGISSATSLVRDISFQSALKKVRELTHVPFSHMIVSESLVRGGAVRCACHFFTAIAHRAGLDNVVFLVADELEVTCADWLPPGARIINLLELDNNLSSEDRSLLLLDLVNRARPNAVLGFNSFTFWKTLDWHIDVCLRELPTKFVGYLGGYEDYVEMNGWGFNNGPVNTLTPLLPLIVTDNERLRNTLLERHSAVPFIEQKIICCYKSLTEELMQSLTQGARNPPSLEPAKILWASRVDGVKQPAILAAIAQQMPEVQFHVYGRGYKHIDIDCLRQQPNVKLMGEYANFSEIPIADKSAFLHTSRSDSMPHVLVEAAAAGLPIVTADTGAISELIDESTGWLVDDCQDISEYVKALRTAIEHRQDAQQRAANLLERVKTTHSWTAFLSRVEMLDIW